VTLLALDLLVGVFLVWGHLHVESRYWPAVALFWALECAVDAWAYCAARRARQAPRRPR
jgi:hypothetical protein